ncbi:SUKH-3 immunity protein-domain-containing protein [Aspergillus floccosus]
MLPLTLLDMIMGEYTIETTRALKNAGWTPGRRVNTVEIQRQLEASGFAVSQTAIHFLSEFLGLKVDVRGPGISCAREPFEFDPLLAAGEDDRFEEWSATIGEVLTPIGQLDQRYFLGIAASGEIYLVADWLASFGSEREAIESLVRGSTSEGGSLIVGDRSRAGVLHSGWWEYGCEWSITVRSIHQSRENV